MKRLNILICFITIVLICVNCSGSGGIIQQESDYEGLREIVVTSEQDLTKNIYVQLGCVNKSLSDNAKLIAAGLDEVRIEWISFDQVHIHYSGKTLNIHKKQFFTSDLLLQVNLIHN
jgi:hypothetical protein